MSRTVVRVIGGPDGVTPYGLGAVVVSGPEPRICHDPRITNYRTETAMLDPR